MRYSLSGFSQPRAVELGMDSVDLNFLRWFVDFSVSGKMKQFDKGNGDRFYWIQYQYVLDEMPILRLESKKSLAKRLKKLVEINVLEHYHAKDKGSFSCFRFGGEFASLISDTPIPYRGDPLSPTGETKDSSINLSKKNITKKDFKTEESAEQPSDLSLFPEDLTFEEKLNEAVNTSQERKPKTGYAREQEVIDIFNLRTRSSLRYGDPNRKIVRARIKEGFTNEEFDIVAQYMFKKWNGTKFSNGINLKKFFGDEFDSHLQEVKRMKFKPIGSGDTAECPYCKAPVSKYAFACEDCGKNWDDFKSAGEE